MTSGWLEFVTVALAVVGVCLVFLVCLQSWRIGELEELLRTGGEPRRAIVPIVPDGGPLPHGGVCRSCGAGIAWRGGSYRSASGEMQAHAPSRCSCGGEIEVLA